METNNRYIISDEELLEIQKIHRELISEVDRICTKCNIKYNMVGGTMLGAIRHNGPIPWDDDADIGFLRNEYEKFREACKTELNKDKYYIQDFRDTDGYRWGYGKLRKRGTEFVRLQQEFMPYEQGIFIDLMPFDSVPDNPVLRKFHFNKCFIYRKMLWSKVGAQVEKNAIKRTIYKLMSLVPEKRLKKSFEKFIEKGRNDNTDLVRILTFPTPRKCYGYKRIWYIDLKRYPFAELMLPGAIDYDSYLKVKYGNYMSLPPEEKRKVHPISRLNLGR